MMDMEVEDCASNQLDNQVEADEITTPKPALPCLVCSVEVPFDERDQEDLEWQCIAFKLYCLTLKVDPHLGGRLLKKLWNLGTGPLPVCKQCWDEHLLGLRIVRQLVKKVRRKLKKRVQKYRDWCGKHEKEFSDSGIYAVDGRLYLIRQETRLGIQPFFQFPRDQRWIGPPPSVDFCMVCGTDIGLNEVVQDPPNPDVVFRDFCGLFGIDVNIGKSETFDVSERPMFFCDYCRRELAKLLVVRDYLKECRQAVRTLVKNLKDKCMEAEERFEEKEIYLKMPRYLLLREQIIYETTPVAADDNNGSAVTTMISSEQKKDLAKQRSSENLKTERKAERLSPKRVMMKYKKQNQAKKPCSFKCLLCPRAFTTEYNLKLHNMCIHQNYRPYKCLLCPKAYVAMGHLKRHKKSHHAEEMNTYDN